MSDRALAYIGLFALALFTVMFLGTIFGFWDVTCKKIDDDYYSAACAIFWRV